MKCQKCGSEIQEGMGFCSQCGTPVTYSAQPEQPTQPEQPIQYEQPASIFNPFAERILSALQDTSFLTICILMTVACICSIAAESFDIISILITVFLWLTYAKSRNGILPTEHLRCVSGSVYANYVIANVAGGIVLVCGLILALTFGSLANNTEILYELMDELNLTLNLDLGFDMAGLGLSFLGVFLGIVFVVAAALILIFNILGMRKIHRLAKSVYQSIDSPAPYFANPVSAKNWLMFFGVCSIISAVSSFGVSLAAVIAAACQGIACIIASVMIGKCFFFQQNNIL